VDSCKKKTNGSEGCVEYCRCSQEETEKQFPDYPRLEREIMVEKLAPRIASFQAIQDSCNTRVFGRPADKLKFE
jgi:hypothetical protein